MPKIRSLIHEDPEKADIRAEIFEAMGRLNVSQAELARLTGIKPSTLSKRIGKHGDIGGLRLNEYLAIRRVAERMGR